MTINLPPIPGLELYPDDASWLAARQQEPAQIGGSDVAALLGCLPPGWERGPWSLWSLAQGYEIKGFGAQQLLDLRRGQRWERTILDEYADARGLTLALRGTRCIVRHPEHPWATVSPDDFALSAAGWHYVEVKTARHGAHHYGENGTQIDTYDAAAYELLPLHYAVQVLWGLHLTGLPFVDVPVAIPQSSDWPEVRLIRLMAQPELQAGIFRTIAAHRQRYLLDGEWPPVDGTSGCSSALAQLFPTPPVKVYRQPDAATWQMVEQLAELRAARKVGEVEEKRLSNEIQAAIGEDYGLQIGSAKALCIRSSKRSVSLTSVEKSAPDIYRALETRGLITTSVPSGQIRLYGMGED